MVAQECVSNVVDLLNYQQGCKVMEIGLLYLLNRNYNICGNFFVVLEKTKSIWGLVSDRY